MPFVDEGQVLTSAGAAAGLDLSLHMIRRDHGAAVAVDSARNAVMPLERDGGQAQFIVHREPAPDGATLEPLLRWMTEHLDRELTLSDLAGRAATTTRTLNRRFRDQTGTTPAQWLIGARMRHAQLLLESWRRSSGTRARRRTVQTSMSPCRPENPCTVTTRSARSCGRTIGRTVGCGCPRTGGPGREVSP